MAGKQQQQQSSSGQGNHHQKHVKESVRKSAERTSSESSLNSDNKSSNDAMVTNSGWSCVVCCQKVPGPSRKELYAIGPCDHPVCYECSTKMRLLCEQNECPICRQEILKVNTIFHCWRSVIFISLLHHRSFLHLTGT